MPQHNPEEKIYITYKTRMTTEARLRRTSRLSNILLAWYSVVLIALSLADLTGQYQIYRFSLISSAISVGTLALSLFLYGEKYNERADQFRDCYLKLQRIYQSSDTTDDKMKNYYDVLDFYENQTSDDYDEMVFDAVIRGQKLENSRGPIEISKVTFALIALKKLLRLSLTLALFALPVILGALWVNAS